MDYFKYLVSTTRNPYHMHLSEAEGSYITNDEGKRYLDMIAGISVNNLGHKHPVIMEALRAQSEKFLHVMVYGDFTSTSQVGLAEALVKALPEGLEKVYFVNSGSEAIEAALKVSRRYTGRYEWIACRNAYHGSTYGALSVMGSSYFNQAYRPLVPAVRFLDFNDESQLDRISRETAAVLIEPIQGEAGVILPNPGYLEKLRRKCDATGTLLIFDEVQTGLGRTGPLFACEHSGVTPDIMVLAKAVGGGLPLGAVVSSAEILDTFSHNPELGHITTFGGHPMSCAAGMAALEFIKNHLPELDPEGKGKLARELMLSHPLIQEVRGQGLLLAVDTGLDGIADRWIRNAMKLGVITDSFLFRDTAIRISPPLTISNNELEEGCRILIRALEETVQND